MAHAYHPSTRGQIPQTIIDDDSDIVSMDVSRHDDLGHMSIDEPSILTMPSAMQASTVYSMQRDHSGYSTGYSNVVVNDVSTLGDGDDVFTLASAMVDTPAKNTDVNSSFAPSPGMQKYPEYYASPAERAAKMSSSSNIPTKDPKEPRKIFGIRLIYLVLLLLLVIFLSVAVALAALIISNQDDDSGSPRSTAIGDLNPPIFLVPATGAPSGSPTLSPTRTPSVSPTNFPTTTPSSNPTPTLPTERPTNFPTTRPSASPTRVPSTSPSVSPTNSPTTSQPSASPMQSLAPSGTPTTELTGIPTASPTPINLREQILALMPPETIVSIQVPSSATSLAMEWIEDDSSNEGLSTERLAQRFALASFHFSNAPSSRRERRILQDGVVPGWLQDTNECNWTGITCQNGQVVGIALTRRDIPGRLVPEWAFLTFLVRIDLTSNLLTGSIPASWGRALVNLESLTLSRNRLSGEFPSSMAGLSSLRILNAEFNNFGGSFPNFLSNLSRLTTLNLFANDFSGTVNANMCARGISVFTLDCVYEVVCRCCSACYFQCGGNTGIRCP